METRARFISVLLGAGASAEAGIPTTNEMTEAVADRLQLPLHRRALEFVHHTLAADAAARGPDARAVDIERLFAAIELLIHRYDQPWSPFVSTWTPGLESFASGSDHLSQHRLEGDLRVLDEERRSGRFGHVSSSRSRTVARAITEAIQHAGATDVGELLQEVRKEMLRSLSDVLRVDANTPLDYLGPLLDLKRHQGSLLIATLNYDRTVEEMAQRAGLKCNTGIETWQEHGALGWRKREKGLRLLKLHGSIDWSIAPTWQAGDLPSRKITKVDAGQGVNEPAVVFGEAGKLRSEGPYLEFLLAWSAHLQHVDSLLIVGYSFRDEHVNEMITRWFNGERTRQIILVDPNSTRGWRAPALLSNLQAFARENPNAPQPHLRFRHFAGGAGQYLAPAIEASSRELASP